jgi:hypothetical protein
MRERLKLAALVCLLSALWACGGAEDTGLFTGNGDSGMGGGQDADSDSSTRDAAPPGDPGISCGGSACAVDTQVCCRGGTPQMSSFTCTDPGSCSTPSLSILCDDAADCEKLGHHGAVCCGTYSADPMGNTAVYEVACLAPAECMNLHAILCNPGTPNTCPAEYRCQLSMQTLPGYYLCIPVPG